MSKFSSWIQSKQKQLFLPKQPKTKQRFRFCPKEDITAYELAKFLPIILPRPGRTREELNFEIEALDNNLKRHIKEENVKV